MLGNTPGLPPGMPATRSSEKWPFFAFLCTFFDYDGFMNRICDPTRRDVMAGMTASAVALGAATHAARRPLWAPAGSAVVLSFEVTPAVAMSASS